MTFLSDVGRREKMSWVSAVSIGGMFIAFWFLIVPMMQIWNTSELFNFEGSWVAIVVIVIIFYGLAVIGYELKHQKTSVDMDERDLAIHALGTRAGYGILSYGVMILFTIIYSDDLWSNEETVKALVTLYLLADFIRHVAIIYRYRRH